jgi:hypothetical protein
MIGIDYAWASPKPSPSALKSAGVLFIVRYLSHDPSKDLVKPELDAAVAAGLAVVANWEAGATNMLGGFSQGVDDAQNADGQASLLGMNGTPIYFSADFDETPGQDVPVEEYMRGVASVIGLSRTGVYGDYYVVKRVFDAGHARYGWQTYAWSGGQWEPRAQLRQTLNGITVAGVSADRDQSEAADFGQWPRPGAKPAKPAPPTLQQGMTGPAVKTLQADLNAKGFGPVTVDGVFGTVTKGAVESFQRNKGLTIDGIVGPLTWAKLA